MCKYKVEWQKREFIRFAVRGLQVLQLGVVGVGLGTAKLAPKPQTLDRKP